MNVKTYLGRIGVPDGLCPDLKTLSLIQTQHMRSVPFENLDIMASRKIVLDLSALYQKIVVKHRGGYCYELNGLLHHFLQELGYSSTMVSGRVVGKDSHFGPEFDHMAVLVELSGKHYIVDVGFGDSVLSPLPISGEVVTDISGSYRIKEVEDSSRLLFQKQSSSGWVTEYDFTLHARKLPDFLMMNEYQQTSPDSHFTQKAVCSMATATGRITISGDNLIVTTGLHKETQMIDCDITRVELLKRHFGISI